MGLSLGSTYEQGITRRQNTETFPSYEWNRDIKDKSGLLPPPLHTPISQNLRRNSAGPSSNFQYLKKCGVEAGPKGISRSKKYITVRHVSHH